MPVVENLSSRGSLIRLSGSLKDERFAFTRARFGIGDEVTVGTTRIVLTALRWRLHLPEEEGVRDETLQ